MCELALTKAQSEKRKAQSAKRKRVLTPLCQVRVNVNDLSYLHMSQLRRYRTIHGILRRLTRTADIPSPQRLRSSITDSLSVPAFLLLDVAPFLSLANVYGTIYLRTLPPHRLCLYLSNGKNALIPSLLPVNCSSPLWSLK